MPESNRSLAGGQRGFDVPEPPARVRQTIEDLSGAGVRIVGDGVLEKGSRLGPLSSRYRSEAITNDVSVRHRLHCTFRPATRVGRP